MLLRQKRRRKKKTNPTRNGWWYWGTWWLRKWLKMRHETDVNQNENKNCSEVEDSVLKIPRKDITLDELLKHHILLYYSFWIFRYHWRRSESRRNLIYTDIRFIYVYVYGKFVIYVFSICTIILQFLVFYQFHFLKTEW